MSFNVVFFPSSSSSSLSFLLLLFLVFLLFASLPLWSSKVDKSRTQPACVCGLGVGSRQSDGPVYSCDDSVLVLDRK